MGSTNFNAPPLKITLLAIGVVIALHMLAAMALMAIKPPTPIIKSPEITPPIEIQMVSLPIEVKETEIAIDVDEPVKELQPQPKLVTAAKPKSKPQTAEKSQPVTKTKPPVKTLVKSQPKNITPKLQLKTQPDTFKAVENEPFRHEIKRQESISTVQADALAAINESKMLAAQAEKTAQEAHAKAMRDAQAAADAKATHEAQLVADAKAAQESKAAADAKVAKEAGVAKEAEAAVRVKAVEKAAAAASNTPVNFNASNANWAAKPNFSFPRRASRGANSGDTFNLVLILRVNKQGGIDSVRLAQSSGNALLDKEAQRQVRSGKFRPFMKNGVPVVGNVTLPISYAVP